MEISVDNSIFEMYFISMNEIKPKTDVALGNPLVETSFRMSPLELKLVLFAASFIHEEHDFLTYRFSVADFAKAINRQMTHEFYKRFRKLGQQIMAKIITLKNFDANDGKGIRERDTVFFRYFDYFDGEGIVEVSFNEFLKPYLLDLRKEFTKIVVKEISKLSSFYSMRLYMLLMQYIKIGRRTFLIKDLRKLLGVEENEYKVFADFYKYTIKKAIDELSKNNLLVVEDKIKRRGRKAHEIEFKFYRPSDKERNETPSDEEKRDLALIVANMKRYTELYEEEKDLFDEEIAKENALNRLKEELKLK